MKKGINISVIVPVYNTEKYLNDCLNSLINQSLDSYEIIIINDGSTDNSSEIISDFRRNYSFIKYYETENMGLGAARNFALKQAVGKYIYFMDSDDYIEVDALSKLYNIAEKENLDLLLFDGESFYNNDIKNGKKYKFNYTRKHSYGEYEKGQELLIKLINDNVFYSSPCLYLVKAKIIHNNDIKFAEGILHEDELFTINLMLAANKTRHISQDFFKRRIRNNSIMTSSNYHRRFEGYCYVFKKLYEILQKQSNNNTLYDALYKKIGSIYRGVIMMYFLLNNEDKLNKAKDMKEVKRVALKYNYFGIKGLLITKSRYVYNFLKRFQVILTKRNLT